MPRSLTKIHQIGMRIGSEESSDADRRAGSAVRECGCGEYNLCGEDKGDSLRYRLPGSNGLETALLRVLCPGKPVRTLDATLPADEEDHEDEEEEGLLDAPVVVVVDICDAEGMSIGRARLGS